MRLLTQRLALPTQLYRLNLQFSSSHVKTFDLSVTRHKANTKITKTSATTQTARAGAKTATTTRTMNYEQPEYMYDNNSSGKNYELT